jgi:hypothetical protein
MQNVRAILVAAFLFTGFLSRAQDQAVIQNYISKYKDIAMQKCSEQAYPHLSNCIGHS